jgi:ABC-2 type transport system permease protein
VNLVAVHARAGVLELVRLPVFVIPTLAFPSLLYLLFAAPAVDADDAAAVMAGFLVTAVLAVAFFQFGVGISIARTQPWDAYVRGLGVAPWQRTAARVVAGLVFAAGSCGLLVAVAVASSPVRLDAAGWAWLALALAAGSIPFSLLGVALGYWLPPRAALPVANVAFLPLVYIGGLWTVGRDLPPGLVEVSTHLPSRAWGELVWAAVEGTRAPVGATVQLIVYGAAFAAFAVWGYRRDEGERFR